MLIVRNPCQQCKKFISALGIDGLTFCVIAKHEIVEKTFEDIYREATKLD